MAQTKTNKKVKKLFTSSVVQDKEEKKNIAGKSA